MTVESDKRRNGVAFYATPNFIRYGFTKNGLMPLFDNLERANECPKVKLAFLLILPYIKDSLLLKLLDFIFAVPQIFQDLRSLLSD